ncbi:NAD-dependent epimerase/dehydratase family protein [Phytoactinopolyspora mesophila]|uniref:NAD-dependent epimerase/dehydratase family protein n=1 Tax=Phytoactinopolyspora mesophila TaxID=2650750 RepID=A0A7K3M4E8_9ACTN|nr:NAD(P)-dependent oxidoreductase [Phytoactinopolyspora mesophila]NDL58116.1 NAD-dependent epimerase/dehydratase family protein [Phytoactinopolyspora mesophila]
MKIFVAGAAGVVGKHLVPELVAAGHDVVGTTRDAMKADQVRALGAEPVVLDALDRDAVMTAVADAHPDVVIHQLTAIGATDFKKFDESYEMTNRLRTEGLDYLLEAAREAGAKRFIAQSFTGWPNARTGSEIKTEEDALDPAPSPASTKSLEAIRHLESAVTAAAGIEGIVLRYGVLYGPGTAFGAGGEMVEVVSKRKMPIVGGGAGVFSFVHVADAAAATVAALENGRPGIYNIVDDEPAPVVTWLPYLADVLGAKNPMKMPAFLAKPMLGEFGVTTMTAMRGSSNAKAKRQLGWTPVHRTWRDGFRTLTS